MKTTKENDTDNMTFEAMIDIQRIVIITTNPKLQSYQEENKSIESMGTFTKLSLGRYCSIWEKGAPKGHSYNVCPHQQEG